MGLSVSTASSTQEAVQNISQNFQGMCSFNCTNDITDVSVVINGSQFKGNIDFDQACAVDGQCQISSTMDAVASIFFSASNSAGASDAAPLLPWPNADISNTSSYQSMRQSISQSNNEQCNLSSTNNMSNVLVFINNSAFAGDITFSQTGGTSGSCALQNTMDAAANATGEATDNAQSGKKAKSMSGILESVGVLVAVIIILIIIVTIFKMLMGKKSPKTTNEKLLQTEVPEFDHTSLIERVPSAPVQRVSSPVNLAPRVATAPA